MLGHLVFLLACLSSSLSWSTAMDEPIQPIPLSVSVDERKVELGRMLFHDQRLSADNSISCASCHALNKGGTDQTQFSIGINYVIGPINSPTVYNSGLNYRQFWDGRAETLEEQAAGPVHNPIEMGSNWPEVVQKLGKDTRYQNLFSEIYNGELTGETIADAIATFERSLITPNSRFDQYLKGNTQAITEQEKQGYQHFKDFGCAACHQGVNVGGNMFQKFGVLNNYFTRNGRKKTKADLGRYNVTGLEQDKHVFKVPSLRMVAHTAPYFHDGSAKTLREAVDVMFTFQLGRPAPDEVKEAIVAFLKTLAGDTKYVGSE